MVLNRRDPDQTAAIAKLEQDLLESGWLPVTVVDPATGKLATGWFPPIASRYPVDWQRVGDGDPFLGDDA